MGADGNLRVLLECLDHQFTLQIPYTGDPQVSFTIAYNSIPELLTVKGESLSFEVVSDGIEVKGDDELVRVEGAEDNYDEDKELPVPFMTMPAESLYNLLPTVFLKKSLHKDIVCKCSKIEIVDGTFNWINTDGVRLIHRQKPLNSVIDSPNITQDSFVISDTVLSALKHLKLKGNIYFGKQGDSIFIWNSAWVIQASNMDRFPDWRAVMPQNRTETARVSTKQLIQALKEITVSQILLYGEGNNLYVQGEEKNRRQSKTIQTFIPMQPISYEDAVLFQTKLLLDLLQCNPSPMTCFSFGTGFGKPLLISSANKDWTSLLMPLRR
jgi:DNA polymerase III sliding clamp (beta) subunit (PCNA family)